MAAYKCPECDFAVRQWPLLKGHMLHGHDRIDLKEAGEHEFEAFAISDEEYLRLKPPPGGPPAAINPAGGAAQNPPKSAETTGTPAGSPIVPPLEPLTDYIGEPVERLHQVLLVNGGKPTTVAIVDQVMRLNRFLWGNPYELEKTLLAHFGQSQQRWVQQCVTQYMQGVQLPDDLKSGGYYPQGGAPMYGNPRGNYQYPQPGGRSGAWQLRTECRDR